jgi:hypothetical protein
MHRLFHLVLAVSAGWGAEPETLALLARAQAAFERVETQASPDLQDTARCTQSQAELLPVVRPAEAPLVRFRKGYCELLGASVSGNRGGYQRAAQDFAMALAAWPARGAEPVPSGLQVLSAVARLRAGAPPAEAKSGLAEAARRSACPATVMPARLCHELVRTGRLWQGWIAMNEGDTATANAIFGGFEELPWASLLAGRQAMREGRYPVAVDSLRKAVEGWSAGGESARGVVRVLGPQPELAAVTGELGAARYLAGDYAGAIASLDAAVRAQPHDSRSTFIRGLAKEAAGQPAAALNDYQSAARAAFAQPDRPYSSAEAHFYRGVWHYRRKAFEKAEDELLTAMNADPGQKLRPDVIAWRRLSAVAGGACQTAAEDLRAAVEGASPFFPRTEAQALLAACDARAETVSRK